MKRAGFGVNFLIIGIVIFFGYIMTGGLTQLYKVSPSDTKNSYEVVTPIPGSDKNTLQLKTIQFKKCAGTMTVDLLLDRSGSMGRQTPSGQQKLARLKEAVLNLTSNLEDNSIIGIQSFDSDSIRNDVDINYYKEVKNEVNNKVNSYTPGSQTPTQKALALSYDVLKQGIPKFPDRKFNFIIISDGEPVPNEQDPRLFNPNPADQIKSLGVTVYSLAIYESNQALNPKLKELLQSIASSPDNYYEAENADQVDALLQRISERICSSSN